MFCAKCGTQNMDDAGFCVSCGADLRKQTPPERKYGSDTLGTPGTEVTPPQDTLDRSGTALSPEVDAGSFELGALFANRYEILDAGKKGGMGAVYKCRDTKLNETVALKLIHPTLLNSEHAVSRFRQEVAISRKLHHKNIVSVYNLEEWQGLEYFTMEWVEGRTLRELIQERKKESHPFSLDEAHQIISQVADALQYAHRYTIHRDVKPENILVTGSKMPDTGSRMTDVRSLTHDDRLKIIDDARSTYMIQDDCSRMQVKLTDFGIAKMLSPSEFTSTSIQMGTPYYMAPEQKMDAASVDKRADIYALGVVLFELLTLENTIGPDLPSDLNANLPKDVDEVFRSAVATRRDERYPDAGTLASSLNKVVNTEKAKQEEKIRLCEQAKKEAEEKKQNEEAERRRQEAERRQQDQARKRREEEERKKQEEIENKYQDEKQRQEKSTEENRWDMVCRKWRKERMFKKIKESMPYIFYMMVAMPVTFIVFKITVYVLPQPYNIYKQWRQREWTQTEQKEKRITNEEKTKEISGELVGAAVGILLKHNKEKKEALLIEKKDGMAQGQEDEKDKYIEGMVFVKGGCYDMGCGSWTSDCDGNEKPVHEVCVDDYYMDKYEVTQTEFQSVMGSNPSNFKGSNNPVESVTWNEASAYCEKVGKRLPTEAEWEYAARSGGKKEKYAGTSSDSSLGDYAWYDGNSGSKTHPVGEKKPNGLGFYDMSGNVYEWCSDWYGENYYSQSSRNNPKGPGSGSPRVLRGGSWGNNPRLVRASLRLGSDPDIRGGGYGFRCSRTQ